MRWWIVTSLVALAAVGCGGDEAGNPVGMGGGETVGGGGSQTSSANDASATGQPTGAKPAGGASVDASVHPVSDAGQSGAADAGAPGDAGRSSQDAAADANRGGGADARAPVDAAGGATADASKPAPDAGQGGTGSGTAGLHAVGNLLFDGANPVRLMGVNRSGTEYQCIQGSQIFDGPSDQASISAMLTWDVNAVRVPLNEDCWLGVNTTGTNPTSAAYRSAISAYVALLVQNGIYPILDLHWTAPGTTPATKEYPMPDMDHSVDFWTSVAGTFANQPKVVLELFNEPYPDNNTDATAAWTCWRDGGACTNLVVTGGTAVSYTVAGMQTLLDAVRAAGAKNFVLLGGIEFSNDLTHWLDFEPVDPDANIGAAWHVYSTNACRTASCYASEGGAVAGVVPVVATEFGATCDAAGTTFITGITGFLDSPTNASGAALPAQNYLAWAWNTNSTPKIIADYTGTPTCYGSTYESHLLATPH